MNTEDLVLDNALLDELESHAERLGVEPDRLIEIFSFTARHFLTEVENGKEPSEDLVTEGLLQYQKMGQQFFQKVQHSPEAAELLSEMVYDSIHNQVYCIDLYGRRLNAIHHNSGYYSKGETLSFSTTTYMVGTKREMSNTLERYKQELTKAMSDPSLTETQISVIKDCLTTLNRTKIKLK